MAKQIHTLFLFLLAFALLAFGTTAQWSISLVEGLCFLLVLLHLLTIRKEKSFLRVVPGFLPLVLLSAYAMAQLLPLPPTLLKLLSPKTWDLYAETIWVIRPGAWMPISVVPKATLAEFFSLTALTAFYLVTVQLLDGKARLKTTVSFFTTFIGFFSLAGIAIFLLSRGRVFWFLEGWPFDMTQPASIDANRNHYAGLMAMVLPVVFAQFLVNRPQVSYSSLREKIAEIVRSPSSNPHVLLGVFLVLLIASLFLSFSWGGILGSLGSLLVFILLLLLRGGLRKRSLVNALYLFSLLTAMAVFCWGATSEPLGLEEAEHGGLVGAKGLLWRNSVSMVGDFPLLGTGFGTFTDIYPRYTSTPMETSVIEFARNEYSVFMVEGGLVGTLLALWFVVSFLRQTYPPWRQRHGRTSVYLCLGGLAGLVAILLHDFFGSALHVGAVRLYFFFFAGLAAAAAVSRSREDGDKKSALVSPFYLSRVGIAVAVLFLVSLTFNVGVLAGKGKFDEIPSPGLAEADTETGQGIVEGRAQLASRFDPLESSYRYALADAGLAAGNAEMTLDRFADALRLNPLNAGYLQRIGLVLDNLGQNEKAEKLLRAGVRNDPSNPDRHKALALWLLAGERDKEGLEQFRQAIALGPQKTRDYLTLMNMFGLDDQEMRWILPEQSIPLLAYGDYLAGVGKEKEAGQSYLTAVRLAADEAQTNPAPFERAAKFFTERQDYNEALEAILAGITVLPENADFRFLAANLYERLGITYRAIEEYRASLALDPNNERARQSLKNILGGEG